MKSVDTLNEWLDNHSDKFITKEYRSTVTFGWLQGVPWYDHDNNLDADGITSLTIDENKLEFTYKIWWCVWVSSDRPKDRWGNTYLSYEDGIKLTEGCYEIGYADDQLTYCKIDVDSMNIEEDFDWQDFLAWMKSAHSDLVDALGEEYMSSGCAHSVTYYISTIAPDSDQWEGFINEYYRAENALTDDDYNFVENIPENTKSKR
jgi:hypothetical protein